MEVFFHRKQFVNFFFGAYAELVVGRVQQFSWFIAVIENLFPSCGACWCLKKKHFMPVFWVIANTTKNASMQTTWFSMTECASEPLVAKSWRSKSLEEDKILNQASLEPRAHRIMACLQSFGKHSFPVFGEIAVMLNAVVPQGIHAQQ